MESTHLHVFQTVLLTNAPQHILLATFLHLSCQQELVQDEVGLLEVEDDIQLAHVPVVLVHLLDVSMHDLEGDQLVVGGGAAGDEEEGGIATVDDLGICRRGPVRGLDPGGRGQGGICSGIPLYSRKLHMRVRRDRTSWVTSLMILAFSLGDRVVNHLARRCNEKNSSVSPSAPRRVAPEMGWATRGRA